MSVASFVSQLFAPKRPQPSYPLLPEVDEDTAETNIPGVYAVGEAAGTPLVLLGLNAGHELVERIGPALKETRSEAHDDDVYDLVIVGSGSSGFAATVAAKDLGLKYLTLEASDFANTFVTMMKGKLLLAEPDDVENKSRVWFEECRKEELLEKWEALRREENLNIHEHEKVIDVNGAIDDFVVRTDEGEHRTRRVVLCIGKAGNPRTLDVPGEKKHTDRIHHRLLDPDDYEGEDIVIVGAGDVACEAAIALAESNNVTMSAIDDEFTYPKKRNIDKVRALEAEGKLDILLSSTVTEFRENHVEIKLKNGSTKQVPYDTAFEMIGAELPIPFFQRVGIKLANSWDAKKWIVLLLVFVAVYSLYSLKSYGKPLAGWPFNDLIEPATYKSTLLSIFKVAFAPFAWLFDDQALSDIYRNKGFQQGYLYSGLYTIVMLVFGGEALLRWRKVATDPKYQTLRYGTLLAFQVGFFLIVNVIAVQAMSIKYAWRFWGLYQPFPLFFNTFFWWYPSDPKHIMWFFVGSGIVGSLVFMPIMARYHGKRFCTWICGCGGLAETLGDRWRHLAPKGPRSRAWQFQGGAIFLASLLVLAIVVGIYETDGSNPWWKGYSYVVDFWLVAVIPIALYPFFGGKVWCRYWCPLAAYNQILSKWFGKLKIVSDSKCIECTQCSKYCQVGVDVMQFAKNKQPFDNSNTACIHCGICIDVCPMDVLKFESSDTLAVDLIAANKSSGIELGDGNKKKDPAVPSLVAMLSEN
jgi:thioredoxin reductase/ferredoxin